MSNYLTFSVILFFLILCGPTTFGHRPLSSSSTSPSDLNLISDGVHNRDSRWSYLALNRLTAESSTCDQTYGFLPCTTTVIGNIFLIAVYGYLMFLAASYLSHGSELLLEILGPGIIGGLFLPILGALPDAMLILVSGLSGTTETAQSQVSIGMGLLAGSTVMLLTVIWGSCVIVGKCDLDGTVAKDTTDTKGFSLTESGVSTDIWTSYAARMMVISVIPFLIVQIPQLLNSTSGRHLAVLIALIVAVLLLISYCLYQVLQPWIQRRKIAYVKHKHVILGVLRHLRQHALGRLLGEDGEPDKVTIEKLFHTIDANHDGNISAIELRAFIVGIQFDGVDLDLDVAVDKIMKDIDTSHNSCIEKEEFVDGISRWLNRTKRAATHVAGPHTIAQHLDNFHEETKREHDLLDVGVQSDEVIESVESSKRTTIKAVLLLLLGTIIAACFADPLVDAVDNFSDATSIPAFFISFIALPLATNSSEAVSAIIFASRDKRRTASLTFSELYGAATMNNLLCLSVFLALIYIRGLAWDFSAEVLVILIVCIVMGSFASFRTHFPLWTSLVAFLLYPFSLALIYVLDYVLGWS
ncbi:sodium/calcium exchanger NCL-like [Fagus crenata]